MQTNVFPIPYADFKEARGKVNTYLLECEWKPNITGKKQSTDLLSSSDMSLINAVMGKYAGVSSEEQFSLIESLKRFDSGNEIMSEASNKVLNTILDGMALGWALSKIFAKSVGLEQLRNINREGNDLTSQQTTELSQKNSTDAAVTLFTLAHYVVSHLSKYRTEEVAERVLPKISLPEFPLLRKVPSVQCVLFYLNSYVTVEQTVKDEIDMVKTTINFFSAVLDELFLHKKGLQFIENFEGNSYVLEKTGFTFRGFDRSDEEIMPDIMVRQVRFEEIVGNREIKLETKRMVERQLTYNPKEGRNPMVDLRGLVRTSMGMGIPGTGKTMLICAAATELKERCKDLKYPFLYSPLNLDIVSKFQGESAERMLAWFAPQNDLSKIVFAPVDDAESVFARRDGREASEGSNSVTKVFLTQTEGASTDWRGQSIMPFYTNNWEIMDPAVLSRIQKRTFILGPQTVTDYLDQNYLFWKVFEEQSPGIVKFIKPEGYEYMTDQALLMSYSSGIKEEDIVPKNETLQKIFHELSKKYHPEKNPEFVAEFAFAIGKTFPGIWAGRDFRNVQSQTADKMMDFDYPQEWWDDPDKFFTQPYDKKFKMLLDLRQEAMKGLSFGRIFLQELVKYADTTVVINQTANDKEVKAIMQRYKNEIEARRLLNLEGINLN